MATVYQMLEPQGSEPADSNSAVLQRLAGSGNVSVTTLAFDASTAQSVFWRIDASQYGSGNITVDVIWAADTATSGSVVWGAAIAAFTPDTDSGAITAKAFGTQDNASASPAVAATAKRLYKDTITVTHTDSIAVGDAVFLKLQRVAADAGDTMAGNALVERVIVSFSDT